MTPEMIADRVRRITAYLKDAPRDVVTLDLTELAQAAGASLAPASPPSETRIRELELALANVRRLCQYALKSDVVVVGYLTTFHEIDAECNAALASRRSAPTTEQK